MNDAASAEPGRIIAGKYRLVRLLGSGGMGAVFVAEHVQVRRSFALKFLHPERSATPRDVRRFEREAELLGRLDHENVVSLHDIGVDASSGPYLVLEYVRGITLREELARFGARPVDRLAGILKQMARGLAHAHALGIVHRDLKPENVMLSQRADGELLVKLLDFGVAGLRDHDAEHWTMSGTALGTAAYMAPEQARGDRTLDARTDVYALGVIAYEALSGARPYTGSSYNETLFKILHKQHRPLAEVRPELPKPLSAAVERALSKQVDSRFSSVDAFVEEIEHTIPSRPRVTNLETAPELDASEHAAPAAPERERTSRRGAVAGLALCTCLAYLAGWLHARSTSTPSTVTDPSQPATSRGEPGPRPSLASSAAQGAPVSFRPLTSEPPEADPPSSRSGATPPPPAPRPKPLAPAVERGPSSDSAPANTTLRERGYVLDNPYANFDSPASDSQKSLRAAGGPSR